jgi:hypothetical protein
MPTDGRAGTHIYDVSAETLCADFHKPLPRKCLDRLTRTLAVPQLCGVHIGRKLGILPSWTDSNPNSAPAAWGAGREYADGQ